MEVTEIKNKEALSKLIQDIQEKHTYRVAQTPGIRPKLTSSEKIKFAYDYYDLMGNISILDVLINVSEHDKELKEQISDFIVRNNLLKPYPNTTYEYASLSARKYLHEQRSKGLGLKGIQIEYNHQNWLEPFDENALFSETKTKHPTYHIFMSSNGTPIKFDKERATQVKLAIIDQGIVPARCIVEGAYPYVAKEELPEYFEYIKTLKGGK